MTKKRRLFDIVMEADSSSLHDAKAYVDQGPDREERRRQARMSDAQLAREKAEEISDERKELEKSEDPIDRQILYLMRQKRAIDEKIAKLKEQKEKREQ